MDYIEYIIKWILREDDEEGNVYSQNLQQIEISHAQILAFIDTKNLKWYNINK